MVLKTNNFLPIYFSVLVLAVFTSLSSCGSKKKEATEETVTNKDTVQEADTVYVWVENLRARKEPGKDGEVLMEITAGTPLISMNESTSFKEKVTLRGKNYEAPWLKVKLPDGRIAWVFGGAVTSDRLAASANDWLITPGQTVGKLQFGMNREELIETFGKENVSEGDVYIGEGYSEPGLIIYKGTPEQLEVLFDGGMISVVFIRGGSKKWHIPQGPGIGTPLEELVRINGKPVSFSGFDWDYGGRTLGFNEGVLAEHEGMLTLVLTYKKSIPATMMGDMEVRTDKVEYKKYGITVEEMILYPETALD